MVSTATVHPHTKQLRRLARLLNGHGDEPIKISFHRSGFMRATMRDPETGERVRYTITPRGTIAQQEVV